MKNFEWIQFARPPRAWYKGERVYLVGFRCDIPSDLTANYPKPKEDPPRITEYLAALHPERDARLTVIDGSLLQLFRPKTTFADLTYRVECERLAAEKQGAP